MATHGDEQGIATQALTASLFESDPEHTAYFQAANDALIPGGSVPRPIQALAMNHLTDAALTAGIAHFEKWREEVDETFRMAYRLACLEEWDDLDSERAARLVDECGDAVNAARAAAGVNTVPRVEFSGWISLVLLGLTHEMEECQPLSEHFETRGAWSRLEWLRPAYEMVGRHLSKVKSADEESWNVVSLWAWRDGVLLSLLERVGILAEPVAGQEELHSGDRPLSGNLYERDPELYSTTAAQIGNATTHRVPDVAKELYWYLSEPFLDQKLAERYGSYLHDTFELAYVLTQSESWSELDGDETLAMIDRGLRLVASERDTRDPDTLVVDPEYRIRNVVYGYSGELPYFAEFTAYVDDQPSLKRLGPIGATLVHTVLTSGVIKGRHAQKMQSQFLLAWRFGVAVALLDLLHEIPAKMPARLP